MNSPAALWVIGCLGALILIWLAYDFMRYELKVRRDQSKRLDGHHWR